MGVGRVPFNIHHSSFCIRPLRRRAAAGQAMVETAIILPLYLIIIFAVLYFGYATLSKQRQTVAAGYAVWHKDNQQASQFLEEFWPWEGHAEVHWQRGSDSEASAGDTRLLVSERSHQGDEYYGTEFVPCQLTGGSHQSSGSDCFNRERLAVSLWNYALGEVVQRFEFVPGQGMVERMETRWDQIARYLNEASGSGTGFVTADASTPPQIGPYENIITNALNGMGGGRWLERRTAKTEATYRPPFYGTVVGGEDAAPSDFATYVSGDYPEPLFDPTTATAFDLTGRGSAHRYAAGEGNTSSQDLIDNMADLMQQDTLLAPDAMDDASLGDIGKLKDLWKAQ